MNRRGWMLSQLMLLMAVMGTLVVLLGRHQTQRVLDARREVLRASAELMATGAAQQAPHIAEIPFEISLAYGTVSVVTDYVRIDSNVEGTVCAVATPHSEVLMRGSWRHCVQVQYASNELVSWRESAGLVRNLESSEPAR